MDPTSAHSQPSFSIAAPAVSLADDYRSVRTFTETLAEPLETEDYVVQTMEDVSPTKWHLAHTSWFFETFLLKEHYDGYEPLNDTYAYLFNSYYIQAGARHCRDQRGYISRPTVQQVYDYRAHVDDHMIEMLERADEAVLESLRPLVTIGLHHEQQHQELLLTDIKHVFSVNPLRPAYRELSPAPPSEAPSLEWIGIEGGIHEIGYEGEGFHYDNEGPRHEALLQDYELASRPVTCGEYLAFMEDDGYGRPELWLSDGWATVQENEWSNPFYWEQHDGQWYVYTLGGMREVHEAEPVSHLSYFEAEAYARWADARLPTEQEWEVAARGHDVNGNFVDSGAYHPLPSEQAASEDAPGGAALQQLYGDVWEWTRSQYSPYPGYRSAPGALGEYNGKFMCNQFVLRGGSCATSESHMRPTYRNFFPPDACWQFTGLRLARDGAE